MRVPFSEEEKKLVRLATELFYKDFYKLTDEQFKEKKDKFNLKIKYEDVFILRRTQGPFGPINYFSFKRNAEDAFIVYYVEDGVNLDLSWREDCYVI